MAKKSNYSKLAEFRAEERDRLLRSNPNLLQGLTPTQIAELFPDYFRKGTPDVGGFREAISKESARKQSLWQGSVDARLDRQGGMLSRMRQEYGGGSTVASGNLKQNQQEAYKAARAEGLSDSAARILVANMSGESLKNPADHHWDRSHMSQGIVQWDPSRAERIKNHFGAYPKDMSVAQQTKAAIWEMKTYYGASYNALTNENLSPTERMNTVVADYERPQDVGGSVANRMRFYNGLNVTDDSAQGASPQQGKGGATPGQGGTATTPGAPAGDTTKQAGQRTEGAKFSVVSGYIVPNDKSLYDTRNAQQCATLGKAFNPSIGRSSSWTIVDGDIKAGQVVATKQYNNPGNDRVGAGYHTGVALTAPNEKGDFLLLEQYNGSGGAKTRWVNKNSYPVGHTGQTTSWGLISSGGKVHDEVSQEALSYGQQIASPEHKTVVGSNSGTPGTGGESAPGAEGSVEYGGPGAIGGTTIGEGEQQSASLMRPVAMVQNLMGMMGAMGGQSAMPLGLITSAMGFIMPLVGSIAGERIEGEGMGDGRMHGRRRRRHHHPRGISISAKQTTQSIPVDNSPIKHREDIGRMSVKYEAGPGKGVETISTGMMGKRKKDPGGVSYGEHQLSTKSGMPNYLRSPEGSKYADRFAGLKPGTAEFNKVYKQVAKEDREGFTKSQQDYITRTHYEPIYRHAKALGFNVNDPRVQEALYSISVQHGGAKGVVSMAKSSAATTPEKQVEALFSARSQYVASKGMNFEPRYKSEKSEILAMDTTKYKQDDTGTQFAQTTPAATTGQVGPGQTTPATGMGPTTQMAQAPKTFMERVFPSSVAAETNATTPRSDVTTSPAFSAPSVPFSRDARTPLGLYSNPSRYDVMSQFGYRKQLDTASVISQPSSSIVPATSTPQQTTVTAMPHIHNTPGPAPDMTSMQMNQIRNQMQMMTPSAAPQNVMPTIQNPSPVTQVLNHDHTMNMIQNPADTPSAYRAFARAYGNETPGTFGEGHFNYGNAR